MSSYELGNSNKGLNVGAVEPIDLSKRLGEDIPYEDHKITFTNRGSCPQKCQVSITVSNASDATVWSYKAERTYTMAPVPLHFKPHITGFLIKLWQWHDQVVANFSFWGGESLQILHILRGLQKLVGIRHRRSIGSLFIYLM